jgi:hypothetical protein
MTDEIKAYFGNHHQFVTIGCMKLIAQWHQEQKYTENIAYVFESGSGYDADVMRLLADAMNDERQAEIYRVGSCTIENKRNLFPLQAADIIAYEVTKAHAREVGSDKTRPIRRSVINLRLPCFNEWYYYNKEALLNVINSARERGTFPSASSTP